MKLLAIVIALFFSILSFAGRCPFCNLDFPDEILDTHVLSHDDENINYSDDESSENEPNKRKSDGAILNLEPTKKRRLLKENEVVNPQDVQLINAALSWDAATVKDCLKLHANANAKNAQGSVLFQVIKSLNDDKVQFDFDGDDERPEDHAIAIIWRLLKKGANVTDAIFENGESGEEQGLVSSLCECIHWHGDYETGYDEAFQQVLDKIISMINVNFVDSRGVTPLAILVESGYFAGVQTLIESSAPVNAIDKSGNSILSLSLNGNDMPNTANLLIQHCAFVDAKDLRLAIQRRQNAQHDMSITDAERAEWANLVELMLATQTKYFMLTKLAIQIRGDHNVPKELELFIISRMMGL